MKTSSVSAAMKIIETVHKSRQSEWNFGKKYSEVEKKKQENKMYRETNLRALEAQDKKLSRQIQAIKDKYCLDMYGNMGKELDSRKFGEAQIAIIEASENPQKLAQIVKTYTQWSIR
jgi:hypothetical protein